MGPRAPIHGPTYHAATGLRAKWMRVSVCGRTDIEPTFGDGTKENATGGNICGTLPQIKAASYLCSVPIWAMGHFPKNGTGGVPRSVSGVGHRRTKWDTGVPFVCDLIQGLTFSSVLSRPGRERRQDASRAATRIESIGAHGSTDVLLRPASAVGRKCSESRRWTRPGTFTNDENEAAPGWRVANPPSAKSAKGYSQRNSEQLHEGRTQPCRQCSRRPHPKTTLCGPFDTPRRSVGALRVNGLCCDGPTPANEGIYPRRGTSL